ncbi:MAG: energy-coupling factor transporter transmembrane component T [Syntrophomonadaceae bacterium]|nr:energy-coupling factor transporter transmembrane component T [Syntrophomonadaceae bacterium]
MNWDYSYQYRDNFIYNLHPGIVLLLCTNFLIWCLIFSHPFYLASLLLANGMLLISAGHLKTWYLYLKFSLFMSAVIIVINLFFSSAGTTTLLELTLWEGNTLKASWEALMYGLGMSLRLMVAISSFALFTLAVDPDQLLAWVGRFGTRTALVATSSLRIIPMMIEDYRRITEVQKCRGVRFNHRSIKKRIKSYWPVMGSMLLSSLERSMIMAESLYNRGYGLKPRTNMQLLRWQSGDYLVLISTLTGVVVAVLAQWQQWSSYSYYPVLEQVDSMEILPALVLLLLFALPAIINWGWEKWPQLRSTT